MRPAFAVAALVALTAACGGNSPTSPSPGPGATLPSTAAFVPLTRGRMTATVDGSAWESTTSGGATLTGLAGTSGSASISGLATGANVYMTLTVPLATGTHTVGAPSFVTFQLNEGFGGPSWSATPFTSGGAGSVTITTATTTHVVGTFSFTAVASSGGATGTRAITNGTFDLSQ